MEPTQAVLAEDETVASVERPLSNILNNADRCDTCGAQAFVWVDMPDSKHGLLFCSHHFNRGEAKLRTLAIEIFDERYKINLKASASAPD